MFQTSRPAGRIFYLALAMAVTASGIRLHAGGLGAGARASAREDGSARTPARAAADPALRGASPAPQSGPPLTSVIDTVYMADGTTAQGVLVITWPAFVAANGTAVGPGSLDVTLGTNGALNVALVPNAGATPAGTYYSVVYQLQPRRRCMLIIRCKKFVATKGRGLWESANENWC